MSIQLDREITQDFERAEGIEWLEPNGLGGWAGTTVAGAHSRRSHGLLVAATPERRTVLLSRLDETIHSAGESFDLGCNRFPGTVAPRGFERLASFHKDLFPVFEYEAGGVRLRKTVAAVSGENTTLVLYEVLEASGPFILSLRPFLAGRDLHALTSAGKAPAGEIGFTADVLRLRSSAEEPPVFVAVPGADFQENPQWWYRFEYELERRRGADYQEDLWTPGVFGRELASGDRLGVVISTDEPAGRDAFSLFEKERKRREKILAGLPKALQKDELARQLALAGKKALAAIDELRPRLAEASVAEVLRAWVEELRPVESVKEKESPVKEKVAVKEAKPVKAAKPVAETKPVKAKETKPVTLVKEVTPVKAAAPVKKAPAVKKAVKAAETKPAAPRARKKAPAAE